MFTVTDPVPTGAADRKIYELNERFTEIPLPPAGFCDVFIRGMQQAHRDADLARLEKAMSGLLRRLSHFHGLPTPRLRLKGVRPHRHELGRLAEQKYADYNPHSRTMTLWTRTAVRRQLVAFRTLLQDLLHEYCHHLDAGPDGDLPSYHTLGFYQRVDTFGNLLRRRKQCRSLWDKPRDRLLNSLKAAAWLRSNSVGLGFQGIE